MVDVRVSSFTEQFASPQFQALVASYAEESKLEGLPYPEADEEHYISKEADGAMRLLCAFDGDELLGFVVVLVFTVPHYSTMVANIESIYAYPEHRARVGVMLKRAAEFEAKRMGAIGLFINAAIGSRWHAALSGSKNYRATHTSFFRSFL